MEGLCFSAFRPYVVVRLVFAQNLLGLLNVAHQLRQGFLILSWKTVETFQTLLLRGLYRCTVWGPTRAFCCRAWWSLSAWFCRRSRWCFSSVTSASWWLLAACCSTCRRWLEQHHWMLNRCLDHSFHMEQCGWSLEDEAVRKTSFNSA